MSLSHHLWYHFHFVSRRHLWSPRLLWKNIAFYQRVISLVLQVSMSLVLFWRNGTGELFLSQAEVTKGVWCIAKLCMHTMCALLRCSLSNDIFNCTFQGYFAAVLKLRQFVMPGTCENRLGLLNSYVCYACQTTVIYQVLPYSVDFKVQSSNNTIASVPMTPLCNYSNPPKTVSSQQNSV